MRARLIAVTLVALAVPFGFAAAQSGPPKQPPAAEPGTHERAQEAVRSESGKAGKQEPSMPATTSSGSTQPQAPEPAMLNGRINVPGAPDSQTVPAKFSARNATIDKQPILAFIGLTEAQQRAIADGVKAANAPVASLDAKPTQELPSSVALQELPASLAAQMPELRDLKYVRLEGRILLVYAPNRFVVSEIKG